MAKTPSVQTLGSIELDLNLPSFSFPLILFSKKRKALCKKMSYKVYVAEIKNLQKHPNADRLQVGEVLGNLVIVGLETQNGELGLFFPPDGEISREFLEAHDLYERKGLDGKKAGGYFGANGKVRGVTLRGVKTDGFWFKIKDLKPEWTLSNLEEGQEFESGDGFLFAQMNSRPLARKFFTEASRKKQDNVKANKPKRKSLRRRKFSVWICTTIHLASRSEAILSKRPTTILLGLSLQKRFTEPLKELGLRRCIATPRHSGKSSKIASDSIMDSLGNSEWELER